MKQIAGIEPGQRRLNGIQTSDRTYRRLSAPEHGIHETIDHAIPVQGGASLLADVVLPAPSGRFPALIAFSPYPRQLQNSGAPFGFIEAGASDFWAPRGYAHVLVNARGTCGSGGTYGWLDEQERRDLYDVIEWTAAQPWCDGNVGMIGISYFAIAQLHAAGMKPPHLRAILPLAGTTDLYRGAAWHGGMPSSRFVGAWVAGLGVLGGRGRGSFRGALTKLASSVLRLPAVHRRFEAFNGEAAIGALGKLMRSEYDAEPWDSLYFAAAAEHPLDDDFWRARDATPLLSGVDIPVYLGCDWDNVPLHLPSTFWAWEALAHNPRVRMGVLPRGGLCWPWESFHVEALAWFDRWLKGRDTGIDEGDRVRYFVHGAERWRSARSWPPPGLRYSPLFLRADGRLGKESGPDGARAFLHFPAAIERPANAHAPVLPGHLSWDTEPLAQPLEIAGPIELSLSAVATAGDVDWIVTVHDVAPDGEARELTQGWLRGSHRALDEARSRPGAPFHAHDRLLAVTPGKQESYSIAVVPTAHRFLPGHRLRLRLASSDRGAAMLGFEHTELSLASKNTVLSSSRLLLPVIEG